jgi:transcriptional regulator with XRE-family HTH domain
MAPAARVALNRLVVAAGQHIRDERMRRAWSIRELAGRAGISTTHVHRAESGDVVSIEALVRIGVALGLSPSIDFGDKRRRSAAAYETADFVHAAMGEVEVRALARPDRTVGIDEPYQHYQFAGRADVLAWDLENLLHIENRTRFPNLQEAAGAYNAKRQYLARALGERLGLGPRGWRSVTHVMACLWSSEILHSLRLRQATFQAMCPDPPDALSAWLRGDVPPEGVTSSLVILDPTVPLGSRKRTIATLGDLPRLEPRHRGYADAAAALRRSGTGA